MFRTVSRFRYHHCNNAIIYWQFCIHANTSILYFRWSISLPNHSLQFEVMHTSPHLLHAFRWMTPVTKHCSIKNRDWGLRNVSILHLCSEWSPCSSQAHCTHGWKVYCWNHQCWSDEVLISLMRCWTLASRVMSFTRPFSPYQSQETALQLIPDPSEAFLSGNAQSREPIARKWAKLWMLCMHKWNTVLQM